MGDRMGVAARSETGQRLVGMVFLGGLALTIAATWVLFWGAPEPHFFFDLDIYRNSLKAATDSGADTYAALPYPPFAFLVLWWLNWVPPVLADQLWTAASLTLLIGIAFVLAARAMESVGQDWKADRWGLVIRGVANAILLIISMPAVSQLNLGQLSLFVLALGFFDVAGLLPTRFQGVLVGLAGAIKLTPLVFVLYFLVTGRVRQALVALGSFVGFTLLTWLVFPSASFQFWTHVGGSSQFGDSTRADNLSIRSALARISPSLGEQTWLWLLLGVGVMIAALWHARRHYQRGELMESVLVVGAAATVVAPIAWPHYLLWLPMAAIWMVLSGRPIVRWLGAGLYFVYSMVYGLVASPLNSPGLAVATVDLLTLLPMVIGVCGLPRRAPVAGPVAE
ncbi:MAG: hypothetical protein CVT62_08555 [Actinobacteria bacterium HGW-Actinobacteria-2]|nr:MAG: hypothetical protein CVT62_08555 [Actinobacteria bacterium HGW-Actinobacteria-2]